MVHYGSRRHRLAAHEVPLVHDLILERLAQLQKARVDLGRAEELYRVVHRMEYYRVGPPAYPEPFTWGVLRMYLEAEGLPEERCAEPGDGEEARGFAPRGARTIGHTWTSSSRRNPTADALGQSHTKTTEVRTKEVEP